ncbi:MAG: VgrG-related protein [Thermoleophilia bacterium]
MTTAAPGKTAGIAGAEVLVAGQALDGRIAPLLQELRVEDNLTLPDTFLIRFSDPGLKHVDSHPFEVGAEVEIRLASPQSNTVTSLIKGQVTAVEPEFRADGITIVARGYDQSHALNRTRHTATYQDVTVADVVEKVSQRAGFTSTRIEVPGGGTLPFVQQSNETDWEFLWRLAGRVGCEVMVLDKELVFRPAGGDSGATPVELKYGETLTQFRPRLTGVQQVEEVIVRGWDHTTKRAIEARAKPEKPRSEIGVGREKVATALGGGTITISDAPVGDQAEADALAKSVMARVANSYLEAEGTCRGAPGLRAGGSIKVGGVGTRFSGTYRITSTVHAFRGGAGYETRFRVSGDSSRSLVELMTPSTRPGWESGGVQIAVVTQNEDPDGMGRVRVRYPELGEETEGWWARTTGPGAGRDKGLMMLPEVGDEVLVAFEHGDVRRPMVLGALWNGEDTPGDLVQTDGSFRLRAAETIGLKADKKMTVTADEELTIEVGSATAVLKKDGSITVKGAKVSIEADGSLTIKAGSSLSLQASGTVQVKGAQVQLG